MYQMNRDEGHTTHNKEYAETKVSHFVCVCVEKYNISCYFIAPKHISIFFIV